MAQFLTFLFIIIAVVWVVRRFAEQSKSTRSGRKPHHKSLHESSDAAQRSKHHEPQHASRPTGPAAISERSRSSRETARMDDPAGHWVDVLRVGEANSTEEAVRQLAAMGPQAYPALRRALRDPAPNVRAQAQRAVEAIAAEQRRQATQPIPFGRASRA